MEIQLATHIAKAINNSPTLFYLQPIVTQHGVNLWHHGRLKGSIDFTLKVKWVGPPIVDADQRLKILLRRVKTRLSSGVE